MTVGNHQGCGSGNLAWGRVSSVVGVFHSMRIHLSVVMQQNNSSDTAQSRMAAWSMVNGGSAWRVQPAVPYYVLRGPANSVLKCWLGGVFV